MVGWRVLLQGFIHFDIDVSRRPLPIAVQGVLSLTRQGDHVLCFIETYGPTRQLIRHTLAKFGVTHTLL